MTDGRESSVGGREWRSYAAPVVCLLMLAACTRAASDRAPAARLPAPAESTLKDDAFSRAVRRGRALLAATRESLPNNVGNDLRCNSCHLDEGTRAYAMPYVGVYVRYPQYRSRRGGLELMEDRIDDCFMRSMNGKPLDREGRDIRDIVAYLRWVSSGVAVGQRPRGTGIDSIVPPLEADTARGRVVYLAQCVRCHGVDGGGGPVLTMPGVTAAPLWGPRSFSVGAGMARLRVTAAFIRSNMPFDKPGTLTPREAFDVAGFVDSRDRPDFALKADDWPKGDPPGDVAYATKAAQAHARP